MAIYYVDFLNGNDANAGTSFATRKRTIASVSGLAAGDTIRLMKSSDPTSIGTATWLTQNTYITLSSANTANISLSQSTDWTASTNVTKTSSTNAGDVHVGSSACSLAIATAFTTGIIAYAPCVTTDLSAYQQVSLFFRSASNTISAGMLYLDLCSDSLGATPIVSLPIPPIAGSSVVASRPITIDYGSALPSGVNSIAIRAAIDPGTTTLFLNNIIACKAPSTADSLTLNSLIGLNIVAQPEWYSIWSINGTTVTLNIMHNWANDGSGLIDGTLTTYKMEPIKISDIGITIPVAANNSGITEFSFSGGGNGDYVNIEGGWDTTTMSSQTGFTVVDFISQSGRGFLGASSNASCNKVIAVRSYSLPALSSNFKIGEYHIIEAFNPMPTTNNPIINFDKLYLTCFNGFGSTSFPSMQCLIGNKLSIKYPGKIGTTLNIDLYLSGTKLKIDTLHVLGCRGFYISSGEGYIENYLINNSNISTAAYFLGSYTGTGIAAANLKIKNFNSYSNSLNNYILNNAAGSSNGVNISIENCNTPALTNTLYIINPGTVYYKSNLFIQNYLGTNLGKGMSEYGAINSVTSPVHTAGGKAWEYYIHTNAYKNTFDVNNYYKVQNHKIAELPVKANKLHTVKIWTRRLFTTTKAVFFVQPIVSGVEDYVVSESSAAANTWEELTITFTPTISSVIDLYIGAQYDATNAGQAFYFDDLSVTIAD